MSRFVNLVAGSICAGCMSILMSGLNISSRLSTFVPCEKIPLRGNLMAKRRGAMTYQNSEACLPRS